MPVRQQVLERVLRPELAAKSAGGVLAKPGVGSQTPQAQSPQASGAHKTGDEVPAKPGDRSCSFNKVEKATFVRPWNLNLKGITLER